LFVFVFHFCLGVSQRFNPIRDDPRQRLHAHLAHVFRRECVGLESAVMGDSLHRVLAGAVRLDGEALWGIFPSALVHFAFADVTSDDRRFHEIKKENK
jgi:hypothetical protein